MFLASSSETAASRVLSAEARSPACRASASAELDAGAIASCFAPVCERVKRSEWQQRHPSCLKKKMKASWREAEVSALALIFSRGRLRRRGFVVFCPLSLEPFSLSVFCSSFLSLSLSVITHATALYKMPAPALALARRPGGGAAGGAGVFGAAASSSSSSSSSNNSHRRAPSSSSSSARRPLQAPPSAATRSGGATYERVLRYPDGLVSGRRKKKQHEREERRIECSKKKGMQMMIHRGHKRLLADGAPGRSLSPREGVHDERLYASRGTKKACSCRKRERSALPGEAMMTATRWRALVARKNSKEKPSFSSSFFSKKKKKQERRIRYPVGNGSSGGMGASSVAESDTEWAPPSPWQQESAISTSTSMASTSTSTSAAVAAARGRRAVKQQQQRSPPPPPPPLEPLPPSPSTEEEGEEKQEEKEQGELLSSPSLSSFLAPPREQTDEEKSAALPPPPTPLPSTPAELLRLARSTEALAAAAADDALLSRSYTVLEGCPWPVPRTLFFLASPQQQLEEENEASTTSSGSNGDENEESAPPPGLAFSMRVRRASRSATSELDKLLGRSRPDGRPLIEVSSLVDGVVAFEREEDAAAFAEQLTSSSGASSSSSSSSAASAVGAASSHELFRATGDAKGVVVLVRRTNEPTKERGNEGENRLLRRDTDEDRCLLLGPLPDPSALAAALKAGKQGELEP